MAAKATFAPASIKQQMILKSDAEILIIGGAAGSGKSYLLQLMPLFIIDDPRTACVMFRRSVPQLRGQGGLFDKAKDIYNQLDVNSKPRFRENEMEALFPNGAKVKWQSMQHVKNKLDIQGLEFTFIGVDEATQFEWEQLEYMMSRLRSSSKYPSRMVMSCNPHPDHKIRELIDWYLDEDGYPIPERDGVIRWFIRIDDEFIWGDTRQELIDKYGGGDPDKVLPSSFSFISSTIYDNPPMLINNPSYLARLEGLDEITKAQLLHGNWDARPKGSTYFHRSFLKDAPCVPLGSQSVRPWDKAAKARSTGNKTPDFTAGIKVSKDTNNHYYLSGDYVPENVDDGDWSTGVQGKFCKSPAVRDGIIEKQAIRDGEDCVIIFSIDPGQAGISEFDTSSRELMSKGFIVDKDPTPTNKAKVTKFTPFAILAENGHVSIVKSSFDLPTYNALMKELESFDGSPSTPTRKDDWVDAVSTGINYLEKNQVVRAVAMPKINAPTMYARR